MRLRIQCVQNPGLYQNFMVMESNMKRIYAGNKSVLGSLERKLWHGTASNIVPSICIRGFDRSFCGTNGKRKCFANINVVVPSQKQAIV